MPNSILSSVLGGQGLKILKDGAAVGALAQWQKLGTLDVDIMQSAAAANEPLSQSQVSETGTYIRLLDNDVQNGKVIQPVRMRISGLCADVSTMENIIRSFADMTATYTITSRNVIAKAMMVCDINVKQTPDMISASRISIELEQSEPPKPANYDPANPADESVYGVSIQSPPSVISSAIAGLTSTVTALTTEATSAASALYSKISAAF